MVKTDEDIASLVKGCAVSLKNNGLLVISARDPRDYNPAQMEMIGDGIAEYKDRPGHIIRFWDRPQYRQAFSRDFNIQSFVRGSELESKQNPVPTFFTTMVALKK